MFKSVVLCEWFVLYAKNLMVFIWLCDSNNFLYSLLYKQNFEVLASNMDCDIKIYQFINFCKHISLSVHMSLICENWFVFKII